MHAAESAQADKMGRMTTALMCSHAAAALPFAAPFALVVTKKARRQLTPAHS
ncbi:hypothetical protein [Acidovorax sp. SUPP3334]|uniref:hypothetical protein n=1 Tax=Acidovorax sp. SUPP3334 TaxID=2920881 RepID=UPI0023DE2412|nr:hypothetical protein [Acidovorax sp. SUPP3334]GKT20920.1 hypothetical protein AVHM3334_02870 [Acidovorax sp. SUPP3334]